MHAAPRLNVSDIGTRSGQVRIVGTVASVGPGVDGVAAVIEDATGRVECKVDCDQNDFKVVVGSCIEVVGDGAKVSCGADGTERWAINISSWSPRVDGEWQRFHAAQASLLEKQLSAAETLLPHPFAAEMSAIVDFNPTPTTCNDPERIPDDDLLAAMAMLEEDSGSSDDIICDESDSQNRAPASLGSCTLFDVIAQAAAGSCTLQSLMLHCVNKTFGAVLVQTNGFPAVLNGHNVQLLKNELVGLQDNGLIFSDGNGCYQTL
jgi:hypothetical protein